MLALHTAFPDERAADPRYGLHVHLVYCHPANLLFDPSLERAFSPVNSFRRSGRMSDGILDAPWDLHIETDGSGHTLLLDADGRNTEVAMRGYDICAPLTAVTKGRVRVRSSRATSKGPMESAVLP
jgi:hypothetical protein